MAQRGGSVINHTRIGCRFRPMVSSGGADVLLALEPAEALRFAHFLSPEGVALVNTTAVLPVTVTTGKSRYPGPAGDPRASAGDLQGGSAHGCYRYREAGRHSPGHERGNARCPLQVYPTV